MIHQMTMRLPWLRLAAAALTVLGLFVIMLLILQLGSVQARSQAPDEQPVAAGITSPAQRGTAVVTITLEATSTIVVPGQRL